MVAEVARGLGRGSPGCRRGWGGGWQFELPAFMVSLTMHGLLLVGLAFAGYRVHREVQREFRSEAVDNAVGLDSTYQDLDQSAEPPAPVSAAGSFAPTLSPTITSAPSSAGGVPVSARREPAALTPQLAKLDVQRVTELVVPTATMLGLECLDQGQRGRDGRRRRGGGRPNRHRDRPQARERDAPWSSGRSTPREASWPNGSGSASTSTRFTPTSTSSMRLTCRPTMDSMTMVVSFGHDRQAMLPKPTAERSQIIDAINKVPLDQTGFEYTFATVAEIVNRWGHYKDAHKQPYHTMVIVVTDETGDDEDRLEDAIASAREGQGTCLRVGLAGDLRPRKELYELHGPQDQARLLWPGGGSGPESACSR